MDDETEMLMFARQIADKINNGARRVNIVEIRTLAEGFRVCDAQRARLVQREQEEQARRDHERSW